MDTVLMLGYHNLQAGQELPGFVNKFTFTSKKDTLVGHYKDGGFGVLVGGRFSRRLVKNHCPSRFTYVSL